MNPVIGMLIIFVPIMLVGVWVHTSSAQRSKEIVLEIQSICKSTHKISVGAFFIGACMVINWGVPPAIRVRFPLHLHFINCIVS